MLALFSLEGKSQHISLSTHKGTMKVGEKQHTAYFTLFDFDLEYVKRALWKYSVKFAKLENFKSYYELSITDYGTKEKNKVVFLLKIEDLGTTSKLYIAPRDNKSYFENSKQLLIDFKVNLVSNYYQEKIDVTEKKLNGLSKRMKSSGDESLQKKVNEQLKIRDGYIRALYSMR